MKTSLPLHVCFLLSAVASATASLPPLVEELRPLTEARQPTLNDAKACIQKLTATADGLKGDDRADLDRLIGNIKAPFVVEASFTQLRNSIVRLQQELEVSQQNLESVNENPPRFIAGNVNEAYWQLLKNKAKDRIRGVEAKLAEADKAGVLLEQQLTSTERDAKSWTDAGRSDIAQILSSCSRAVKSRTRNARRPQQRVADVFTAANAAENWTPLIRAANALWGPLDRENDHIYTEDDFITMTGNVCGFNVDYTRIKEAAKTLEAVKKQAENHNIKPAVWALIRSRVILEATLSLSNSRGCTTDESLEVVRGFIDEAMLRGAANSAAVATRRAISTNVPALSIADAALAVMRLLVEEKQNSAKSDAVDEPER